MKTLNDELTTFLKYQGVSPSLFFLPLSSRLPKNLFGEQVILPRKERGSEGEVAQIVAVDDYSRIGYD